MSGERSAGDFGGRLREARERRGIPLRQIANSTKISVGVLEALERNDISRQPGGIFGRAFVRSYAVEVGLDPEATIQDFMTAFPSDSVTVGHPTSARHEDHELFENERRRAGTFLSLMVISVPVAGVVVWIGTAGLRVRDTPPAATVVTATPAPAPQAVVAPAATAPASAIPAAVPSTAESAVPPPPDPAPAAAERARLMIVLSVKSPCWVSATVDGQKAIERLLQAGEQHTIDVQREMTLTAGDAAAISMTLNGAATKPLGKAGDVVTVRLTPNNFKELLQVR